LRNGAEQTVQIVEGSVAGRLNVDELERLQKLRQMQMKIWCAKAEEIHDRDERKLEWHSAKNLAACGCLKKAEEAWKTYEENRKKDEAIQQELTHQRMEFIQEFREWEKSVGQKRAESWLQKVYEVTDLLMKEVTWDYEDEEKLDDHEEAYLEYTILESQFNDGEERFFTFSLWVGGGFSPRGLERLLGYPPGEIDSSRFEDCFHWFSFVS